MKTRQKPKVSAIGLAPSAHKYGESDEPLGVHTKSTFCNYPSKNCEPLTWVGFSKYDTAMNKNLYLLSLLLLRRFGGG